MAAVPTPVGEAEIRFRTTDKTRHRKQDPRGGQFTIGRLGFGRDFDAIFAEDQVAEQLYGGFREIARVGRLKALPLDAFLFFAENVLAPRHPSSVKR